MNDERVQAIRERLEEARDPARAMQIIDPRPPFVTLDCADLADLLAEREKLLAVLVAAENAQSFVGWESSSASTLAAELYSAIAAYRATTGVAGQ